MPAPATAEYWPLHAPPRLPEHALAPKAPPCALQAITEAEQAATVPPWPLQMRPAEQMPEATCPLQKIAKEHTFIVPLQTTAITEILPFGSAALTELLPT